MITKWWNAGNHKAINYLNQILEKLDKLINFIKIKIRSINIFFLKILKSLKKLKSANIMFMEYMNKSEEKSNMILSNLDRLKSGLTSGSKRYRQGNVSICNDAINSTQSMIDCIKTLDEIPITEWANLNSFKRLEITDSSSSSSLVKIKK
jgi:hypothetical protein